MIDLEKLFSLIVLPEISLADLRLKLPGGFDGGFEALYKLLQDLNMKVDLTVDMFGALQIPSLRLGDMFPDLDLSSIVDLLGFPDDDFDIDALRQFLNDIELPSFRLRDFPGVTLPTTMPSLPNIDINIDLPSVIKLPTTMPSLPNIDIDMLVPKIDHIGGILMKVKLCIGFMQCLSLIPSTLGSIPWPDAFMNMSRILTLTSVNFFSAFGNLCAFSTTYLQKFVAQMILLPFATCISGLAYLAVIFVLPRCCAKKARQTTRESERSRFFELIFLVVYTLYTSVSTSIFRLFDCQEVQGSWYLSADFTVKCFEAEWSAYMVIAIAGIVLYTIGIPLVLFLLLRRNRSHLYAEGCPEDELSRHAIVKKQLGAVYKDCKTICLIYLLWLFL